MGNGPRGPQSLVGPWPLVPGIETGTRDRGPGIETRDLGPLTRVLGTGTGTGVRRAARGCLRGTATSTAAFPNPKTLGIPLGSPLWDGHMDQGPGTGTRERGPGNRDQDPGTGTRDQGTGTWDQGPSRRDSGLGTGGYAEQLVVASEDQQPTRQACR